MATLSSHILNGADGTHAANVEVTLTNLQTRNILFQSATDEHGRLSQTIDIAAANSSDRYELIFNTNDYWRSKGVKHSGYLQEIVLRFSMPQADARYHMPLIISPNSYSTWLSMPE